MVDIQKGKCMLRIYGINVVAAVMVSQSAARAREARAGVRGYRLGRGQPDGGQSKRGQMPKFLGHYGIQPGIRHKFDDLVVLECRQLFDHAARRWLEHHLDEVLCAKCQGSDKRILCAHLELIARDGATIP